MRHVTLALAFSAIPAATLGQAVSCPDCRHVASYFRGEGGFIGTVADGADEVVFVASCGSVSTTGEARVAGRTAAQLFNDGNGLACDREGGSLEIAGLKDGGWYWITDENNSAVGNLVSKEILANESVELTSAGAGVTMMAGSGAVFVKETATGRVGILPNILPEPRVDVTRKCGFADRGRNASTATLKRFVRVTNECEMGDGGTILLATTTNSFTGATTRVMEKGSVVRPSGTGQVVVSADLWGNGSGHFTTDPTADLTSAAEVSALLGHPSVSGAARSARLTGVTFSAKLGTGPTAADLVADTEAGGVTMDLTPDDGSGGTIANLVTFTIGADSAYCNADPPRNNSVVVAVTATMPAADATSTAGNAAQLTPYIARHPTSGVVGGTSFAVVCGSSSSSASLEAAGGPQQENS
jgi:hypothetical protein